MVSEYKFVVSFDDSKARGDFTVKGPHRSFLNGFFAHSRSLELDAYGLEEKLLHSLNAPTAYIEEVYVSKAYRNQRIGSKMMRVAIKELSDLGVEYLYFEAIPEEDEDLRKLVKFYKTLGFDEIVEFKGERMEHWPIMIRQLKT